MIRSGKPIVGLTLLLVAGLIIGYFAPFSISQEHTVAGQGCYCHNSGIGLYVNGTDVMATSAGFAYLGNGGSFTFLVRSEQVEPEGVVEAVMAWTPSMSDNAKFAFDPQEVRDNSAQDEDSTAGKIAVLFKITAPNETGSYTIALSTQGTIAVFEVRVRPAQGQAGQLIPSFAAISNVEAPVEAKRGGSVGMNATLQNKGSAPCSLYIYATDADTGEEVFPKVYSAAPVAGNGTITLSGAFVMPDWALSLKIHSGHVEEGQDVDDDAGNVSVRLQHPPPPTQKAPIQVLVEDWGPGIVVIAASMMSVQSLTLLASRRKQLLIQKAGKLKVAVVNCAFCGFCKKAISHLGEDVPNLLSHKVGLAPIPTSASDCGPVDVAFVVGTVRTAEEAKAVKEAREKAKFLVAFGACPVFGVLPAGERRRVEAVTRTSRKPVSMGEVTEVTNEIRPLSDYVKVDLTIPGCPPPPQTVRSALETILCEFASKGGSERNV